MAFLAYFLNLTLKNQLRRKASGITLKEVLETMAAIQMVGVQLPTNDGRVIVLPRYTTPRKDQKLILNMLAMRLPKQPTAYLMNPVAEKQNDDKIVADLMRQIADSSAETTTPKLKT